MTDLTGAELDFSVARRMGLDAVIVMYPPPCPPPDKYAGMRSPACFVRTDQEPRLFRPSRGGAAAWEVWVWLVAQCQGDAEIAGALVAQQQHIADDFDPKNLPTYTCRAVVALGEAG